MLQEIFWQWHHLTPPTVNVFTSTAKACSWSRFQNPIKVFILYGYKKCVNENCYKLIQVSWIYLNTALIISHFCSLSAQAEYLCKVSSWSRNCPSYACFIRYITYRGGHASLRLNLKADRNHKIIVSSIYHYYNYDTLVGGSPSLYKCWVEYQPCTMHGVPAVVEASTWKKVHFKISFFSQICEFLFSHDIN